MDATTAQQLDRCNRAMDNAVRSLQRAQESLALDGPQRVSALMAARDEIDITLRVLRWRPRARVSPAVMAVLVLCSMALGYVSVKAVVLLTEGRPAVEKQR